MTDSGEETAETDSRRDCCHGLLSLLTSLCYTASTGYTGIAPNRRVTFILEVMKAYNTDEHRIGSIRQSYLVKRKV